VSIVPGKAVVAALLKISDGGAHISLVILFLASKRFLVHKDLLKGCSDVQRRSLS